MILEILNHTYQYEAEKLLRVFFPNEKIHVVFEKTENPEGAVLTTEITDTHALAVFHDGKTAQKSEAPLAESDDKELLLATQMYKVLTAVTGYTPKWGLLTGIRPSKLLIALQEEMGKENAARYFTERFFVAPEKTALAESVAARENAILATSKPESCSLYVSIPFCPTRCSYCSFVSHAISSPSVKKLIPDYVALLSQEIAETGKTAKELGLNLESVYFGGGTPTTLTAEELGTLLSAVDKAFDLTTVREYTVESGRPDTITKEKLDTLYRGGVTRISINPQTFNDRVLENIGRKHNAAMTEEAFCMARDAGFRNINMDLIAGLPGDTTESFAASVDKAISFIPENITVHTLSLKRSSNMGTSGTHFDRLQGRAADEMLHYAYKALTEQAYFPYYMYRQARTLGNLENTGYTKDGFECLYNIFMMEECHTVFAVGAGAVTKLKAPHGKEIERIFNYKYPYEYISGFAELQKRKAAIMEFYKKYGI